MAGKKFIWIMLSLFVFAGCESLEDTYKDRAGDGEIRYLGQCTKVSVTPGWEKLNLTWTNSPDPLIDKIKVVWVIEGQRDSVMLDSQLESYSVLNLKQDQTYEVSVCSVDKDGRASLPVTNYVRPYTKDHEAILSFPQLISKYFFIKDRLAIMFSDWSGSVAEARLTYTKANGDPGVLTLNSAFLTANRNYLLPDAILPNSDVILERKGYLGESAELVDLPKIKFSTESMFSVDFKGLFLEKYGKTHVDDQFVNSITEFEIDYTLSSLEDILYLPNLTKLVLGKNRFLSPTYLEDNGGSNKSASKLTDDVERSKFVLKIANQLNGLTIERYNKHFLPSVTLAYMTEMGNPTVPETLSFLSPVGWVLSSVPSSTDSGTTLSNLFDGSFTTDWKPQLQPVWRSHEITVNMNSVRSISGVRVVQRPFGATTNNSADTEGQAYAPNMIFIQVSTDGITWTTPTWVEGSPLGNTGGEITVIHFKQLMQAMYIKFTLNDRLKDKNYSVGLADIGIFY